MAQIELTLPDSLLRKAQDFMPEALADLRNICDALEIGADISAILEKDLTAFLYGKRSEDKADIDRIAELLNDGKVIAHIQNSGRYYISELFRHYCDVAMRWEVFGEMFPMETTNGRTFFRDYCAVAIQYLNATKAELMAIDTGSIQFEQTGRQFTSYKLADLHSLIVEDADAEPVPVQQGTFAPLTKEAYIKAAGDKVKEWRKCIAAGKQEQTLERAVEMLQMVKPCADAYLTKENRAKLLEAIKAYNDTHEVPATEHYVAKVFVGTFAGLMQHSLQPVETSERMVRFRDSGEKLYCTIMNTNEHPDNIAYCSFLAALGVARDFDLITEEQFVKKRMKDGKPIYHTQRYSYRIIQSNKLPVPTYAKDEHGNIITDDQGNKVLAYANRSEIIELISDKRFVSGYKPTTTIDYNGKKKTIEARKDVLYLIPASTYNNVNDAQFWTEFVLILKGNTNLNETDLMERLFHYTERIAEIEGDSKLGDSAKKTKIDSIRKNKPRDKKRLADAFKKAVKDKDIKSFKTYSNKVGAKIWKWQHIQKAGTEPDK